MLIVSLKHVGLPVLAAAPVPDQEYDIWRQAQQHESGPGDEPDRVPQVLGFLLMGLSIIELDVGDETDFRDVADEASKLAHQLLILPLRGLEKCGRQLSVKIVEVHCFFQFVERFVDRTGSFVQQRLEV